MSAIVVQFIFSKIELIDDSNSQISSVFTLLLFPRLVQITHQQTQNWQPAKRRGENRVLKNHQLLHGNLLFGCTSEL